MRELDGIIARSFGESRFVLAKLITQQNPKFTIVNTGDIWIVCSFHGYPGGNTRPPDLISAQELPPFFLVFLPIFAPAKIRSKSCFRSFERLKLPYFLYTFVST